MHILPQDTDKSVQMQVHKHQEYNVVFPVPLSVSRRNIEDNKFQKIASNGLKAGKEISLVYNF